jgi:tRNA-dihydrouridine synthase A
MMAWTDRHCRYFMRLLAPDVRLYTEMLTAKAVLNGDASRLLAFDEREHPVAVQLGGSDPAELAQAARVAEAMGYDEVNLNVGCPSDRVQSGRFGACLMAEPRLVADCLAAMIQAVSIPVSVKTRIGIDDSEGFEFVHAFVGHQVDAGCRHIVVHARKAILSGLSPQQNRAIPPLRYPVVYQLKEAFPDTRIILNGGIDSVEDVQAHLCRVDGVMIGRWAYKNPWVLAEIQRTILRPDTRFEVSRASAIREMAEYAARESSNGIRLDRITRHMTGLYSGIRGAKAWRRYMTAEARVPDAGPQTLLRSLDLVEDDESGRVPIAALA